MEKMTTIKKMGFIIDIVLGVLLLVYLIQGARKGFWRLIMPLIVAVVIYFLNINIALHYSGFRLIFNRLR